MSDSDKDQDELPEDEAVETAETPEQTAEAKQPSVQSHRTGLVWLAVLLVVAVGITLLLMLPKRDVEPDPEEIYQKGVAALKAQDFVELDQHLTQLESIPEYYKQWAFLSGEKLMATLSGATSIEARQMQLQKALRMLDIARANPEFTTRSLTLAGIAFKQMGNAPTAERLWLEAVTKDPNAVDAHRQLAIQYYDNGVLEKAQFHLRQVAELAPEDPRPLRLMGIINKDFARNRDALENFRESFRRDPDQPGREDALLDMAEVQIRLRMYGDALITLEQSTPSADSLAMQGECLLAQNKQRDAREKAKEALAKDANSFRALLLRGTIALESRDLVIARQVLESAVKKYPTREVGRFKLAQTYSQLKEDDLAKQQLAEYEALKKKRQQYQMLNIQAVREPTNADIRFKIGQMALELYGPQMAETWFAAALRINPNHSAARQELIRLQASQRPPR